ncbi:DUF485 domain-containing protein [Burkholderia sp. Bp8963]|uniref:DUF485 domain-containing protein n=1 Tax=Burkholderia sp. Bp8963 TaxID=2184547 RepID=UPI000F979715|nr:DUF485 domain-containing protein [Burkholderia sp. Bp8963]RQS57417.1 DUF485 domain-containing protein [Burkholderia sp. Bp8963]
MSNIDLTTSNPAGVAANPNGAPHTADVACLVQRRIRLSLGMSVLVLVAYFAFILIIAFAPGVLTLPFAAESRVTVGIVIGIGLYWFCAIATGAYVWIAGRWIDPLVRRIAQ